MISDLPSKKDEERSALNQKISESVVAARVVSGCLVRWHIPGNTQNVGYTQDWAKRHVSEWDVPFERRAGGMDKATIYGAQHIVASNKSSLFALIAKVVDQLYKGCLDPALERHFKSIRVALSMDCSGEDFFFLLGFFLISSCRA